MKSRLTIQEPRPGWARAASPRDAGKGVRAWRGGRLLAAVLVVLAAAPTASAMKPARELVPAPDDMLIANQCDFPVLGRIDGAEIDTTFFDRGGDPIKKIGVFPGQRLVLTNLETERTIALVNAGSTQVRALRDGSVEIAITGHGPLPNEIAGGAPGIWYLDGGRVVVVLDAAGAPTSVTLTGNLVNLCAQLAPPA